MSQHNGASQSGVAGSYWDFAGGHYDFIGEESKAESFVGGDEPRSDWW